MWQSSAQQQQQQRQQREEALQNALRQSSAQRENKATPQGQQQTRPKEPAAQQRTHGMQQNSAQHQDEHTQQGKEQASLNKTVAKQSNTTHSQGQPPPSYFSFLRAVGANTAQGDNAIAQHSTPQHPEAEQKAKQRQANNSQRGTQQHATQQEQAAEPSSTRHNKNKENTNQQSLQQHAPHQEQGQAKQGVQQNAPSFQGGSIATGKTSNKELDALLKFLVPTARILPCDFFPLLTSLTAKEFEAVFKLGRTYLPIFSHHHWCAGFVERENGLITCTILDSAPSKMVHEAITLQLNFFFPRMRVTFGFCPRQTRYSEDCGIYLVTNFLADFWKVVLPTPTQIILSRLRAFYNRVLNGEIREDVRRLWKESFSTKGDTAGKLLLGGNQFISHEEVRAELKRFFASSLASQVEIESTWQEANNPAQTWLARVIRPCRSSRFFETIWHHEVVERVAREFHDDDDDVVTFNDNTPSPHVRYSTFHLLPELALEPRTRGTLTLPPNPRDNESSSSDEDEDDDEEDEESTDDENENDIDEQDDNTAIVIDPISALFRRGHHIPSLPVVAQMSLSELITILRAQRREPPPWAVNALAASTRSTHQRMLKWLTEIPPTQESLTQALGHFLEERRKRREWTWSTALKNAVSIQGALALLPLYRAVLAGLSLKTDIFWTQLVASLGRSAKEEIPRVPKAMTPQTFLATLAAERDRTKAAVLLLMWYTTQRVGCVLQLAREDVALNSVLGEKTLTITFRRGKGAKTRGPYTVHTTKVTAHLRVLEGILNVHPKARLFKLKTSQMLPTIRLVDPALEARSVRRGALQAMAAAGVPLELLMRYSGHTQEKTLLRYLNWGVVTGELQRQMQEAGQALQPTL